MHKLFSFGIPKGLAYFLYCLCLNLVVSPQAIAQLQDVSIQEKYNPHATADKKNLSHIKALIEQKQTDRALVMLKDIFESGAPSYRADEFMFLYAQALREKDEANQAIPILEQLLEKYPFSPLADQARWLLGNLFEEERLHYIKSLLEQKQTDQVLVILEDIFKTSSPYYQADEFMFLHAQALREKDKTNQAIPILEQLLEEHPFSPLANQARWMLDNFYEKKRLHYIKSLLEQKQTDQVLVILKDIFESGSLHYLADEFMFLYAQALREKDETNQAIISLEQLLEEYPFSRLTDQAHLLLGNLYIESEKVDRAIAVLTNALKRFSNPTTQSELLHSLRRAYEMKGDYNKAAHMALKQLDEPPEAEHEELLGYIQNLILQKMDEQTLGDLLETFPFIFPGDLALIRLIELHTAQRNEVLAEQETRAFLLRFPNHPYAQTAMALRQSFISKIKSHRYIIAAALPLSEKMKPFGTDALNGIRLALQEGRTQLGDNTIGIVVKDSALPPVQLHRELEQVLKIFKPISLIGPMLAQQVQNVGDLPDRFETPFITPTASLSDVKKFGQFWFSTALTTRLQVTKLVDHAMHNLGFSRFCILSPKSTYGKQLAQVFEEIVVRNGGEIITAESYSHATTDASFQIIRLKDKDLSLYGEMLLLETEEPQKEEEGQLFYRPGFDAIFLPGHPTDVAFLSAQLAYYDIKVPLLGSNSWNRPDLLKWGKSTLNGSIFGDALFLQSTDPRAQTFIRKYREQFQVDPSIFAAQAYDAMQIILDTISHGATNGQEVRDQLLGRYDFPALGGLASFGESGVLNRKVYMIQIANGRFIQIN